MISVKNLSVRYGDKRVLRDSSIDLSRGERAALMGPSGCGKTSLINAVMGLVKSAGGSIRTEGKISCLFQEPRLLPWRTAAENVNAVLSDGDETMPQALDYLARVGLQDAADKYPHELSGGMQQRCALARALAYGGEILILDEPLKGLDAALREEMRALIAAETAGKTLLLVTHERSDAEALCDKIYVFRDGTFVAAEK